MEIYTSDDLTSNVLCEGLVNALLFGKVVGIDDDNGKYLINGITKTFSIDVENDKGIIEAIPHPIVGFNIVSNEKLGNILIFSLVTKYGVMKKEVIFNNIRVFIISA